MKANFLKEALHHLPFVQRVYLFAARGARDCPSPDKHRIFTSGIDARKSVCGAESLVNSGYMHQRRFYKSVEAYSTVYENYIRGKVVKRGDTYHKEVFH